MTRSTPTRSLSANSILLVAYVAAVLAAGLAYGWVRYLLGAPAENIAEHAVVFTGGFIIGTIAVEVVRLVRRR